MKKRTKITLGILAFILAARILAPYFLLKEANNILANLDGYHGHMEDLNLNLYKGAYEFENLTIEKTDGKMKSPFFEVDLIDISIDWNTLIKMRFVGELRIENPTLNFAIDSTAEVTQTGTENNWLITLEELIPFDATLNVFELSNGTIQYSDYSYRPSVEVKITDIMASAYNLSNINAPNKEFPAKFKMTGISDGKGELKVESRLNFLKEIPDFDLNFELRNANLTQLNNFTKAYGKFDIEEGRFSLFSEVLMKNGNYNGYVKPLIEDLRILNLQKEKDDPFLNKLWEGIVSVPAELLENQQQDRVATKSPIKGSISPNKSAVNVWKTIWSTIGNAFVKVIPKKLDNTIQN